MTSIRRFVLRLVAFVRSGRAEADLAREISAHLHFLEDDFVARGMSRADARAAARRAFGGQVEQMKARHRDARSFRWLDESWLDFKLGVRMLIKYPGLSLVGGVAMAVAIGIGTAFFGFLYSYLYATLPLPDGDRIVALENWDTAANNEERQALHDLFAWREQMTSVQDIAAFRLTTPNLIVPGGPSESIRVVEMTAAGFRVAQIAPLLGRALQDADEREGAPPVIVIGHDVWRSRFMSDPGILGRRLRLGHIEYQVVGVMPMGFAFPVDDSYWVPLTAHPARFKRGQGPELFIFGRLAAGATRAQAQAELTAIGLQNAATFPDTHARLRPEVMPYIYPLLDIQGTDLWEFGMMQLTVSLLLVVVAVNIAILVYARTATRQSEISVRSALGASRRRIVSQLFVEALVLSGIAAAVGILLALVGLKQGHLIMQLEGARMPHWIDTGLPPLAAVYVVGLTVVGALIAGVIPALQATGKRAQASLRTFGGPTGLRLGRTWSTLIVTQVAFAVIALPVALGMGWHEARLATKAPAFRVHEFLAVMLGRDPAPEQSGSAVAPQESALALAAAVGTRLATEAGIASVTVAVSLPGLETIRRIEIETGAGTASARPTQEVGINQVDERFFDTFGATVMSGRGIAFGEVGTRSDSIVVNRTFVQRLLGDRHPIGQRIRYVNPERVATASDRWYEIVGVVSDLERSSIDPELLRPVIYHPLALQAAPVRLILRLRGETPDQFAERVRSVTTDIDPTMRVGTYPLSRTYRQQEVALRLVALVMLLIMVSVLLLSAAGVYALMSFTVSQRRKEIAIRAALGADPRQLIRSTFSRAAAQLMLGLVAGLAVVTLMDRSSGGDLLSGASGVVLPLVSALVLAVGLAATLGPARRGLRIHPTQALREE